MIMKVLASIGLAACVFALPFVIGAAYLAANRMFKGEPKK